MGKVEGKELVRSVMRRYETGLNMLSRIGLAVAAAALVVLSGASSAWAAKFNVVHPFCSKNSCNDGEFPLGPLWMDSSGNIFGVTKFGGKGGNAGEVYELARQADGTLNFHALFSFLELRPEGGVVVDTQGNLYGELSNGQFYKLSFGFGKHHDKWGLTGLQVACQQQPNCGTSLTGGLTYQGAAAGAPWDGVSPLYGAAGGGGLNGGGTVFQLAISGNIGTQTVLYNFCSQGGSDCTDGYVPNGPGILDSAGNLYGTTVQGGANKFENGGAGVAYKLSPDGNSWTEVVLYNFCSLDHCRDGARPFGSLAIDASGNLFGTTIGGGACRPDRISGCGVLYKLVPNGTASEETLLHMFCQRSDCKDGSGPEAGPIIGSDGKIFGTTYVGGGNDIDFSGAGGGTVYELAGNSFQTLHRFCSLANCADGEYPATELRIDSSGNLYGTTQFGGKFGGTNSGGTVFRVIP
jgi:uncharacterized repeat protein (TIGR03803 family)